MKRRVTLFRGKVVGVEVMGREGAEGVEAVAAEAVAVEAEAVETEAVEGTEEGPAVVAETDGGPAGSRRTGRLEAGAPVDGAPVVNGAPVAAGGPVEEGTPEVVEVDTDPRFVVTIAVEDAPEGDKAVRVGQVLRFGIHSPARTFWSEEAPVGKTFDLEVRWNGCDGKLRSIEEVRVVPPQRLIEEFDGYLEVGHSYRAEIVFEDDMLDLVKYLVPPHHHAIGIYFENEDEFPELRATGVMRTIVFEVESQEIEMMRQWEWWNLYSVKIIEALPIPPPED